MIKKLKENETEYIRDCSKCGSSFTYTRSDYFSNGYENNYVRCPYCSDHQQFLFHKVYKSDAKKQKDYKTLFEEAQRERQKSNNTITSLQTNIDKLRKEKVKIESAAESNAIRFKNDIAKLEREKLRMSNMIKRRQEEVDRVCQEKMELEDELESLKSAIDKLGIVLKYDTNLAPTKVEATEDVVELPKKKRTKKKEEKVEECEEWKE